MRQLVETGWMHNRLRMVVASFLTKHLLIDWRGWRLSLADHLIDGEILVLTMVLAVVFKYRLWCTTLLPNLQSDHPVEEKFILERNFIRKYIPELQNIPDKHVLFWPWLHSKNGINSEYWQPIVEHKEASIESLSLFQIIRVNGAGGCNSLWLDNFNMWSESSNDNFDVLKTVYHPNIEFRHLPHVSADCSANSLLRQHFTPKWLAVTFTSSTRLKSTEKHVVLDNALVYTSNLMGRSLLRCKATAT